ncbi:flagellar hook capping FlgD N-terminal domain-containing protein [Frigidibacter sp. MR17.24]|uniref:flagellar hook capping FlgD N-terminal domain-containing protein n=1 Tax=Frigidibacter sp. MR17.24 TaxID=3127345 RepID=UPI003013148A
MAVTEVLGTTTSTAATQTAADTSSTPQISSDFQTFLTMLTTQLQNQDPLNPMEATDFAVQLATFSGVEQQVKTNSLLEDLGTRLNVLALSDLVGWVGLEAEAEGPVWFSGDPVELTLTPDSDAERELLSVYDSSNHLVRQQEVPLGTTRFDWTGTDAEGDPLPEGAYHFVLDHVVGGVAASSDSVSSFSTITEARNEGGSVILVREGGLSVAASAVTGLKSAGE